MSTSSSCLDVDQTTPAVVEWKWNDATHYLAKPDPKIDHIILRIRFCGETFRALFELCFPINLKGVDGVSNIFIRIHPSSLISLDFAFAATIPDAAEARFDCTTIRLAFQLNRNLDILAPIAATEPVSPTRAQSGRVLDALRMLSEATSFSVYIEATKLPKAKLQSISDAVAQAGLNPFRYQHDLASMYHGTGAKVVDLSAPVQDAPPSYDETEPPPPMAPINERKRQRVGSEDGPTSQIAMIWAELRTTQKQNLQLQQRVAALEKENRDLKREVEQLQTDDHNTADMLEELDSRLLELQDNHEDLGDKVDFIRDHGVDSDAIESFIDKVKNRVLDDISTRLSRG
ncbi:hypothetical protein B0T10DRAFT_142604 [Thelonectria olida]|uniref:Uncharacterized protein n=1 Tax=Thelonectria olida TaxID=1576542 RepID=A0A9P9AKE7_9HYPO|nr:hypothetical protein B0T10DRAFT_142604 [Thelonectria olida]